MVADLWDVTYQAAGPKKPMRYPRPWAEKPRQNQRGNAAGRTPEQVKALLREHFGQPEAPV